MQGRGKEHYPGDQWVVQISCVWYDGNHANKENKHSRRETS